MFVTTITQLQISAGIQNMVISALVWELTGAFSNRIKNRIGIRLERYPAIFSSGIDQYRIDSQTGTKDKI